MIDRSNDVLKSSDIKAWFLVKADELGPTKSITEFLMNTLEALGLETSSIEIVQMNSRHQSGEGCPMHGGRVLGGRYSENLRNPSSPAEILEHVLIGSENPASAGGSFVFTQRFNLNWPELNARTSSEIEKLIGREQYTDELIPTFDSRSHIRSSHTYDKDGHTIKLLRIGLPLSLIHI